MDKYQPSAVFDLGETCVSSVSLNELAALSDTNQSPVFPTTTKLNYGAIRGSETLRANIASLYNTERGAWPVSLCENILITPGAIAANLNVFYALVSKGDHVICHYPTYQQLHEVPASLGAEVSLWRSREDEEWQLDIEELKRLIRPRTKLVIIKYIPFVLALLIFLMIREVTHRTPLAPLFLMKPSRRWSKSLPITIFLSIQTKSIALFSTLWKTLMVLSLHPSFH